MKIYMHKTLRTFLVALAMSSAAFVATAPLQPAMAQVRALPDFTDLVDQVGPSVVNIRTMEKVAVRAQQGGPGDEDMMEFFRRFGIPTPNTPGSPGRHHARASLSKKKINRVASVRASS